MASSEGFRRILVAFDGSKDSAKAVRYACSLSSKYGSKLSIVHVYHPPAAVLAAGPGIPIPDLSDVETAYREAGVDVLSRGVEVASREGVKAKGDLLEGPSAVEAITSFAVRENVDLIVLGTRGVTGFKKLIMGSVSSGVVSHAHCPVLVVR